ncbi:MAG: response regulator, partial [Deltaproteobacteria bacterium]|nr:response regulator [Deltaproteobacteria bacterium]
DEERFVKWNKQWETVTGFSDAEIRQMYGTDFFEGSGKTLIADRMMKVFVDGIADAEAEIITKQGKRIPYYFTGLRKVIDGKPHLVGLGVDITDRKQAEKALQKEFQMRTTLLDNIPDCIALILKKGTREIVASNKRARKIGAVPGQTCFKTCFLRDDTCPWCLAPKLWATGEPQRTEIEYRGSWYEGFWEPISEDFYILYIFDITDRKNLESQLQQAHKMEAIGTLAGGIAHEFNNILGIIFGNIELAMEEVPEWNTARHNLEEIRTNSLRARDVVKQMLNFSRRSEHAFMPINLCSFIDESINFIRFSIPTTIKIKKNVSAKFVTINADPTQINQVLLNLSSNAAHAMRDKGGILEIGLENVDLDEDALKPFGGLSPGTHVKLTVRDTGSGIETENLEHIFDPFFTTKEVGEGSGMGLSVVHGIVKDHGGNISVESEPGNGTAFHILIPVIEEEVRLETEFEAPLLEGSERILFVDDEESLVLAAKKNLEDMGYVVAAKTSPVEALEMFKEQPDEFDLVATDMTMPDIPGDRLAAEIMKIRPKTPIVLCTGHSDRMNEEQAEEMGIRAYVMKPYLVSELAATIRRILDQGKEEKTHEKGRVLVVDDEKQMRTLLRQMLESAGYEVMEAPSGKVALWLFKEKAADVIVTDLVMPEKEGIEAIMELKRDFPDVKIIAISGGGTGDAGQYLDIAK